MAAVVDGRARLGWVMDGAKILPFRSAHLVACCCRAGRGIGEEGDDDSVCLLDQEAAEFVEPDFFRGVVWWMGELSGEIGAYGSSGGGVVRVGERVV